MNSLQPTERGRGAAPATTVVIVTYNSADDIRDCVTAVRPATDTEIVVVDNASTDGTPAVLEQLVAEGLIDTLVHAPGNDGFAVGVNIGIAAGSGGDVFLLNPDAVFAGASLDLLREAVRADARIGVASPVVNSGSSVAVMSAGRQPTLWPMFTHFTGLARAFPRVRALRGRHLYYRDHAHEDQDVGWVSGCCMYIPRAVIDEIGVLTERWFMYGEDIEYCHRASLAGYDVRVVSAVTAEHQVGASVRASGGRVSTMWAENTYDYYRTEFRPGPVRRTLWRAVFSLGLESRAVLFGLRALRDRAGAEGHRANRQRFHAFAAAVWRPTR